MKGTAAVIKRLDAIQAQLKRTPTELVEQRLLLMGATLSVLEKTSSLLSSGPACSIPEARFRIHTTYRHLGRQRMRSI